MEYSTLFPCAIVPPESLPSPPNKDEADFFSYPQENDENKVKSIWDNFENFWTTKIPQDQKSKGIHLKITIKAFPPGSNILKKLSEIFHENYIYYPENTTQAQWCLDLDLKDIRHLAFLKPFLRSVQFLENVEDTTILPVNDEYLWIK